MVDVRLYAGSFDNFGDSMAEAIESAMNDLLLELGKAPLPMSGSDQVEDQVRDRRLLFLAIARGVIEHLQAREEAFRITVDGTAQTVTPDIQVQQP